MRTFKSNLFNFNAFILYEKIYRNIDNKLQDKHTGPDSKQFSVTYSKFVSMRSFLRFCPKVSVSQFLPLLFELFFGCPVRDRQRKAFNFPFRNFSACPFYMIFHSVFIPRAQFSIPYFFRGKWKTENGISANFP